MFSWIDSWPVLARQIALMLVPMLLTYFRVPQAVADAIAGPFAEFVAIIITGAGIALVGWIIRIGQRREQPEAKIAETAALPEVKAIEVRDPVLAGDIPNPKVVS
jgi:hypothetical protein